MKSVVKIYKSNNNSTMSMPSPAVPRAILKEKEVKKEKRNENVKVMKEEKKKWSKAINEN